MKYIFFLLLLASQIGYSQHGGPISIALNESNIITLIFPGQILKVVEPSADFMFSYEQQSSMGVLKAKKTKQLSNLTVTTNDGYVYSFVLAPSKDVANFVYVMTISDAVGRINVSKSAGVKPLPSVEVADPETPAINTTENTTSTISEPSPIIKPALATNNSGAVLPSSNQLVTVNTPIDVVENTKPEDSTHFPVDASNTPTHDVDLYGSKPNTYYSIFCDNIHIEKPTIKNVSRKVGVIELKLNDITLDKNEMYFSLQIINGSAKAYTIKDLKFFIKGKSGHKEFNIKPLYVHNFRNDLGENSEVNAVYVLKNIRLSDKQQLYIVLEGLDHERFIMLTLPNEVVNR
ncbi:DUF4138 domain-containing protein [Cellulophaga sp. L1A9]|uniref:DUF4138 domain-containing protein n=1 Tax=Cellulophaga sp. L1A9 TaxID=2686362 RepID=UPI00131C2AB9|nr:DUF4138 domain-containing protein [Cellulophaga sp. L1A9]